ncbi:uncharacterized protein LOC105258535 isoform X2 [Camponotus floridanus]|uniref:uncharacterized protein LOC105258535 isoform X2 n=1 Tax=Camponotus floridanus TaxID=104421 RepID=UPI000DC6CF7A|nr:uncharacterized protein LOC105258535 isoform X2 [Camponotus floridanus]
MRYTILALTVALCLAFVSSNPLPQNGLRSEILDRLVMAETDNKEALRNKRTIGILRTLFPDISQRIEAMVNTIVAEVIRVLGPVFLRNVLGGGNSPDVQRSNTGTSVMGISPFGDDDEEEDDSETKSTDSNSRVSISLPTFPDDEKEEEIKTSSSSPAPSTITESGGDVNPMTTTSIVTTTLSSLNNEVTASL